MIELKLIFLMAVGFLSFWIIDMPSELKDNNPVRTIGEYFHKKWKTIALSLSMFLVAALFGNDLPDLFGNINTPKEALLLGGTLPAITDKLKVLFERKT
jgi:hypothetical protein